MPNTPVPSNISLGTYVQDGVRSGPIYKRDSLDTNNNLVFNNYDKYGPGILYSSQNTWNIKPNNLVNGNICSPVGIVSNQDLPLIGDGKAATLLMDNNGKPYLQLDWPRVPGVTYTGPSLIPTIPVTIFGTDWYGAPLQHTYNIGLPGYYPAYNPGNAAYNIGYINSSTSSNGKAFYTITGVHVNGTFGANQIAVETTNIFGLPYKINDYSDIMNFSWAGNNMMDQAGTTLSLVSGAATVTTQAAGSNNPILLTHQSSGGALGKLFVGHSSIDPYSSFEIVSSSTTDTSTVNWLIKNGGLNLIKPGDSTPASATTSDVRGLVQIPNIVNPPMPPDGTKSLIVTSYVYGADQFINQLAAAGQPQGYVTGSSPPTAVVAPLTAADLYGVPQYYTGVPA